MADDDTQNADTASTEPAPVDAAGDPILPPSPVTAEVAPSETGPTAIFIVTKQPTPGGTVSFTGDPFASLDEATTDADRLAILQPGFTFLVFESRRSAAVPIPDVVNTDIPQV